MRNPSDRPIREDRQDGARAPASREGRLKAALKANMARRKAQAKARGVEDTSGTIKGKD